MALLVLLAFHVHLNLVAYFQVGVVTELGSGDDSVALVSDVNDDFLLVDGNHGAFHHLVVGHLVESFVIGFLLVGLVDACV